MAVQCSAAAAATALAAVAATATAAATAAAGATPSLRHHLQKHMKVTMMGIMTPQVLSMRVLGRRMTHLLMRIMLFKVQSGAAAVATAATRQQQLLASLARSSSSSSSHRDCSAGVTAAAGLLLLVLLLLPLRCRHALAAAATASKHTSRPHCRHSSCSSSSRVICSSRKAICSSRDSSKGLLTLQHLLPPLPRLIPATQHLC